MQTCQYLLVDTDQTVSFVIEKKVNEIELGYILHEGHDIVTDLLLQGLARLRSEKTYSENIEDYRAAQ